MQVSPLRRLRRSFREVGPRYTAQKIINAIFPKRVLWANTAFIIEIDIRDWPRDPTPDPEMRWANEKDGKLFGLSDMSEAKLLDYLGRGAQIAICERDGVVVGYFIYDTGDIDSYRWLRYRLTPDVVWTSMTWTAPQYRGKGIHGRVRQFAVSDLSRQGYVRMLASIDAANISSLRASIKKCSIVGSVSFIRLFDLTAVWVNGRMRVGRWHKGRWFEIYSDLFHIVPGRPYGPVDAEHFGRLIRDPEYSDS